jgi:hypothetical protein
MFSIQVLTSAAASFRDGTVEEETLEAAAKNVMKLC